MPGQPALILGEFNRILDDRFRLSLPPELLRAFGQATDCVLVKHRAGCLGLWVAGPWQERHDLSLQVVRAKIAAGGFQGRVQRLGRLLSTRARRVQLAPRGRLLVPEGFREFLQVEAGGEVTLVGAAVCIEIWNPRCWLAYVEQQLPRFARLLERLSG
jgi:MraZ protein